MENLPPSLRLGAEDLREKRLSKHITFSLPFRFITNTLQINLSLPVVVRMVPSLIFADNGLGTLMQGYMFVSLQFYSIHA